MNRNQTHKYTLYTVTTSLHEPAHKHISHPDKKNKLVYCIKQTPGNLFTNNLIKFSISYSK